MRARCATQPTHSQDTQRTRYTFTPSWGYVQHDSLKVVLHMTVLRKENAFAWCFLRLGTRMVELHQSWVHPQLPRANKVDSLMRTRTHSDTRFLKSPCTSGLSFYLNYPTTAGCLLAPGHTRGHWQDHTVLGCFEPSSHLQCWAVTTLLTKCRSKPSFFGHSRSAKKCPFPFSSPTSFWAKDTAYNVLLSSYARLCKLTLHQITLRNTPVPYNKPSFDTQAQDVHSTVLSYV